ncbi:MAG: glucokinase [Gammaproteobacteria bacterium]|nr:glucokinase [Gammaproteobacteria bacterium]
MATRAPSTTLLVGDIGGTNCRLALATAQNDDVEVRQSHTYPSQQFPGLTEIIYRFLREQGVEPKAIDTSCFGVAGPVQNQQSHITNLPWLIDSRKISADLEIETVTLINDLEAAAWSIPRLKTGDLLQLSAGKADVAGNRAIIAIGTGLGEAGICMTPQGARPFPTEGGHCSFAPATALDFSLQQYLAQQYDHVSWERVISGMGLENIFQFLLDHRSIPMETVFSEAQKRGELAAEISHQGLNKGHAEAMKALELMVTFLAREAGNLALKTNASGGVYIAGGIPPKIIPLLQRSDFIEIFQNKGRMSHLLEATPLQLILNEKAALIGAASYLLEN